MVSEQKPNTELHSEIFCHAKYFILQERLGLWRSDQNRSRSARGFTCPSLLAVAALSAAIRLLFLATDHSPPVTIFGLIIRH